MQPSNGPDRYLVVGLDETPESWLALNWAVHAAVSRGVGLRIVRAYLNEAVYWPTFGAAKRGSTPPIDRYRADLDSALEVARDRLGDDAVTGRLVFGSPAVAILAEAEHAELVVLGSRHPGRLGAAVLGSVVNSVTARAECPVAVVTGEAGDGPVVVGTDGSPDSDDALAFAFDEADRSGRPLTVVHCWQPTQRHDRPAADLHASIRAWLAGSVAPYQQKYPGVTVRPKVIENSPAAALAGMSEQALMVVVGSRGLGGVRGLLLGSVSQGLLHRTRCPVVIVRSAGRSE